MLACLAAPLLALAPPELPPDPGTPEAEAVDLVPDPIETPAAEPAPATVPEPAAVPEPAPAPEPGPAIDSEVAPGLVPLDEPIAPLGAEGSVRADRIPPGWVAVDRPDARGTGLFIGAAVSLGIGISFQLGDRILCGGCALGFGERFILAHTFAGAAAAGAVRGRADAYDDAVVGRTRDGRRAKIAGAVLLGLGLGIGAVNEGLWWSAFATGEGPYAADDWMRALAVNRAVLDISTIAASTGVALLTWQARYRRDRAAFRNARVLSFSPSLGRDFAGATLQGSF